MTASKTYKQTPTGLPVHTSGIAYAAAMAVLQDTFPRGHINVFLKSRPLNLTKEIGIFPWSGTELFNTILISRVPGY